MLQMSGTVEQIIFRNEKNGYAVIELNNGEELVAVVGTMPFVSVGEMLHVFGGWIVSQTYGTQFKAQAVESSMPSDSAAIMKYLSSGAVKGIGPATAKRLVDSFGENTMRVLEEDPARIAQIKGISRDKALAIGEEIRRVGGIRETMLKLSGFGIVPEEAVRVWKSFGPEAEDRIRKDPYCICGEGLEIDFSRAERIAAMLEKAPDDQCRLRAGVIYVLKHNENNGHTCLPQDKLTESAVSMLGIARELVEETLKDLTEDGSLIRREFGERAFLFLPSLYRSEVYIAGRIRMMLRFPAQSVPGVEGYITTIEEEQQIQ